MTRHWMPLGGLVLALGFLPTLAAPFDFADDGNLVYPAPAGTDYPARWWDRVTANVEHLGPFRPVLWAHWELQANTLGADPGLWRLGRLAWCGLAATAFLWWLRELGVPPAAALLTGAAAFWNPVRTEVWVSLTLAEGVAMPYLFAALAAAVRARGRSLCGWDAVVVGGLLAALGCKNTFAAVVPALLILRRPGWAVAAAYLAPLAVPVGHLLYFQRHWHPGQYAVVGPSWRQLGAELGWLKGAAGLDFLGVGIVAAVAVVRRTRFDTHPAAVPAAVALLGCGLAVYLPLDITAARYTLPAVWGVDLLLALLLARLFTLPGRWPRELALGLLAVGVAALAAGNLLKQEKAAARNRLLWQVAHHLEATAPAGAVVEWADNVEEGIHLAWHLRHRGRPDLRFAVPVPRVELPPPDAPPTLRVTAGPVAAGWRLGPEFADGYRLGRRRYTLRVDAVTDGPGYELPADAVAALAAGLR